MKQINLHQLRCIKYAFEYQLEDAEKEMKDAELSGDKNKEEFNRGKKAAYTHVLGKLELFFETNNIK